MTHGSADAGAAFGDGYVSQRGYVEKMTGDRALVRIYQNSACGGCQLQGSCSTENLTGNSGRLVEAIAGAGVDQGSLVDLNMKSSDGMLSVLLSFVLPLVLIFTVILSMQSRGVSDVMLAALSLGCTAAYFGVLSLFRNVLRRRISFTATLPGQNAPVRCANQSE